MSKALSNISTTSASRQLKTFVSKQWLGIHARSTGFVKRRGSLNVVQLVEAILTVAGTPQKRETIQAIVSEYNMRAGKSERIFYKPLHNRLRSDGLKDFMAALVVRLQERVISGMRNRDFNALLSKLKESGLNVDDLLLHDGTYWKIHESFSEQYPACRYAKKAELVENTYEEDGSEVIKEPEFSQMGLQTTYSMKSGSITELSVTGATANEPGFVHPAEDGKSVLHLMDAGYCDSKLLRELNEHGDYFITRLRANSAAVIEEVTINGDDFSDMFKGKKLSCREFRTFREHDSADITVRLSDGSRYRAVRFYSKKEHQARNFVTNIMNKRITAKMICAIYKIRWQIERLFLDLKSGSNLTGVLTRVENILYVMLFASLCAHFLKQLVAGVVTALENRKSSLYRISVYSGVWLRQYLSALFSGDLKTIKQIVNDLRNSKGCYEQVRTSKLKHDSMKTLLSVYKFLFQSLTPSRTKKVLLGA